MSNNQNTLIIEQLHEDNPELSHEEIIKLFDSLPDFYPIRTLNLINNLPNYEIR